MVAGTGEGPRLQGALRGLHPCRSRVLSGSSAPGGLRVRSASSPPAWHRPTARHRGWPVPAWPSQPPPLLGRCWSRTALRLPPGAIPLLRACRPPRSSWRSAGPEAGAGPRPAPGGAPFPVHGRPRGKGSGQHARIVSSPAAPSRPATSPRPALGAPRGCPAKEARAGNAGQGRSGRRLGGFCRAASKAAPPSGARLALLRL